MHTIRFAFVGAAAIVSMAGAADLFVSPGDTAGIIAAIQIANADPDPDTIHLASGSVYQFTEANFVDNALPFVEGVLTIDGNGASIVRLAGASSFRILTNNGDLTINNLTITGGSSSTGAGIRNNAVLTLNNCTMNDNRGGGNGGAIYNPAGARFEATGTVFHRNAANGHGGGAVSNDGEVVFSACTITENEAAAGGAINNSGSLQVDGCAFIGNFTTSGFGGAISNYNQGTLQVTASSFSGNQAGSSGGAITHRGVSMTLEDCSFDNNAALTRNGGAVFVESGSASAERCVFTTNAAEEHGGAIDSAVLVAMTDCLIGDNTANLDGGGMRGYNAGGFDLNRVTVATNTAGREGGGVYAFSGATTILNSTISGNAAGTEGGGLRFWSGSSMVITSSTIHANTAGVAGGGLRIQSGPTDVSNTIISGSIGGDIAGPISDLGYNLVEDGSGLSGSTSKSGNPLLAPLDDNGGLTPTHHLIFGSPAIHAGDCAGGTVIFDQRGVARSQDSFGCDIGAYESPLCLPDLNGDVKLDFFDVSQFIAAYSNQDPIADIAAPFGVWNFFDISAYIGVFSAGCP